MMKHKLYIWIAFTLVVAFPSVMVWEVMRQEAGCGTYDKAVQYAHEDRIGKMACVNGMDLMIINHNFWASTYTMSDGKEVDDDFIDSQFPAYYVVKLKSDAVPLLWKILAGGVLIFINLIGPVNVFDTVLKMHKTRNNCNLKK